MEEQERRRVLASGRRCGKTIWATEMAYRDLLKLLYVDDVDYTNRRQTMTTSRALTIAAGVIFVLGVVAVLAIPVLNPWLVLFAGLACWAFSEA
jgi:hypothetical protein